MDKTELVVVALKQRMGDIVSDYELQVAMLRAEITELVETINAKEKAIEEYSASLSKICD